MRLIAMSELSRMTGLSRSTIRSLLKRKAFPEPRIVGDNAHRWVEAEIEAWIQSRPFKPVKAVANE